MDTPQKETSPFQDVLSSQNRRRSSYFQRLGIQKSDDTDASTVDDFSSDSSSSAGSFDSVPHDDFRNKFLRKLAYNNVWVPQARRSPKHQVVTIFDWDDTLLPTTWLREYAYETDAYGCEVSFEVDEAYADFLQLIVQHAKGLLETAIKAGRTYIITNAMSGWVELSAARWAPELLPVLRKVQVISARDKFEAAFPRDVGQWKIQAFLEVQRQLDATRITNLIALGDMDYEMEAARIMGAEFSEGLVKTVKFQPDPDLQQHLQQLELVAQDLERIIGSVENLKA